MCTPEALLGALQLSDSFFPSGAFAYSWGLETYVSEGLVRDREDLARFVRAYLGGLVKRCDCIFIKLAYHAAGQKDLADLARLDKLLHSMKPAREIRDGSLQTGRQVLRVILSLHRSDILAAVLEWVTGKKMYGHQPVMFGAVSQVMGIPLEAALLSYLYSTVSSIASAGVRLIPLGHTDAQRVISEAKPVIVRIFDEVKSLGEEDIASFAPAFEVRAMRHEGLAVRLFKS
jgi:urease accessory protein